MTGATVHASMLIRNGEAPNPIAAGHARASFTLTIYIYAFDDQQDEQQNPKVLADRLGHARASFTLDRYTHLFAEQRQRSAVSLLDFLPKGDPGVGSRLDAHESQGAD